MVFEKINADRDEFSITNDNLAFSDAAYGMLLLKVNIRQLSLGKSSQLERNKVQLNLNVNLNVKR
jgi:hypothetical protein